MPRVYQSPVKETTRKAPLESPHHHPPYQLLHAAEGAAHTAAAEKARHTAAKEAAQVDTPRETESDTPSDTHTPPDTDNPTEIQAASDKPSLDNAAHVGTMSGPPSGMDPSQMPPTTSTLVSVVPPTHPLPRPSGGCSACFSLCALLVGTSLPNLRLLVLSGSDISAQKAKNL